MLSTTKSWFLPLLAFVLVLFCAVPAYAANTLADVDDSETTYADGGTGHKRDEHGLVSWLNTDSNNPYHNLITLRLDLGAEFADYEGSEFSEGVIVKCRPGDIIELPVIHAKDGYTFVGWSQGGVPNEIEWDIFTYDVEMTQDAGNGHSTALYAVYMDEEGNGFCTGGAYKYHVYEDRIDELKAAYSDYLSSHKDFEVPTSALIAIIALGCAVFAFVLGFFISRISILRRGGGQ